MNKSKLVLLLLAVFVVSACVIASAVDVQNAIDRVDALWRAENAKTLNAKGSRVIDTSRGGAMEATRHALEQIGFRIVDIEDASGLVSGERLLKDSDINDEVRRIEEPRFQRIFIEEVGILGRAARLKGEGFKLNVNVRIRKAEGGVNVTISRVWTQDLNAAQKSYKETNQIAPTALKAGVYEFWRAFDNKVEAILSEQPTATGSEKAPSDWILPPRR